MEKEIKKRWNKYKWKDDGFDPNYTNNHTKYKW